MLWPRQAPYAGFSENVRLTSVLSLLKHNFDRGRR